jgi:hypothetical protein
VTVSSTSTPSVFAFVVYLAGDVPGDLPRRLILADVRAVEATTVDGLPALLIARPGRHLGDAAIAAEAQLQDVIGSKTWMLLCSDCGAPLNAAGNGSCAVHGVVPARLPRLSRHRNKSAHKRESLGAGWSRLTGARDALPVVSSTDGDALTRTENLGHLPGVRARLRALLAVEQARQAADVQAAEQVLLAAWADQQIL